MTELLPDESAIHLRAVRLAASEETLCRFRSFLSEEERARADRFAFPHLKTRYALSQGALRLLLGQALLRTPGSLQFSAGSHGKPALVDSTELQFNKSHSGELAVVAVARSCEVGVDVEQLREVSDAEQIAARYFSPAESAELLKEADPDERRAAFFRCWTRKEAYVKAVGGGLSIPLDEFQVTLSRQEEPRIVRIGDDAAAAAAWVLEHVEPAEGFVGALAYAGRRRRMEFHGLLDCDSLLRQGSGAEGRTGSAAESSAASGLCTPRLITPK